MIQIKRTHSSDPHFLELVKELDKDLAIRDGEEHEFYAQLNQSAVLKYAVVIYAADIPCGCGALKVFSPGIMEVKRMYVAPQKRRLGIASVILQELERWCKESGNTGCILETGKNQPEAIALYTKHGYHIIPNYGKYAGVENSVCFQKNFLS